MFSDVDDSLRELLIADLPVVGGEVDIAFERPTREWSSRLAKPTINLYLADVRERTDFRFSEQETITTHANGTGTRRFPPRRFDLLYMLTAWTKEPADEHRILARSLRTMLRFDRLPVDAKRGAVSETSYEIYLRTAAPDHLVKPVDLWGVLDNEARASLAWIATVPVELDRDVTSPLVTSTETRYRQLEGDGQSQDVHSRVAGVIHRHGDPLAPVPHARVTVVESGSVVTADREGRFVFDRLGRGTYSLRIEGDGLSATERVLEVPSAEYRIEV